MTDCLQLTSTFSIRIGLRDIARATCRIDNHMDATPVKLHCFPQKHIVESVALCKPSDDLQLEGRFASLVCCRWLEKLPKKQSVPPHGKPSPFQTKPWVGGRVKKVCCGTLRRCPKQQFDASLGPTGKQLMACSALLTEALTVQHLRFGTLTFNNTPSLLRVSLYASPLTTCSSKDVLPV